MRHARADLQSKQIVRVKMVLGTASERASRRRVRHKIRSASWPFSAIETGTNLFLQE